MRAKRIIAVVTVLLLVMLLSAGCFLRSKAPEQEQQLVSDIPYVDGATYTYDIQDQQGTSIGEGTFGTVKGEFDGTPVWIIETSTDIPGSVQEQSKVYTDVGTLSPIHYETALTTSAGDYKITADYGDEDIKIDAETPNGPQNLTRPRPDKAYDNDQLLMLVRAFPLQETYSTSFNLVIPKSANTAGASVKVVGRENATVPAGDFDCWKVQLGFGGTTQSVWYATDGSRPMVKYDNGQTVFLLTDISGE